MLTFLQLGRLGRLGNQLWQIASVIGLAKTFGHDFAFPPWINHEHHLSEGALPAAMKDDIDVQAYFRNKLPVLPAIFTTDRELILSNEYPSDGVFRPSFATKELNFNIKESYLQHYLYFANCAADVRHYFEFDIGHLIQQIGVTQMKQVLEILCLPKQTCGIHIRMGDYLKKTDYHPIPTRQYYLQAMTEFPTNTHFIAFSDEPEKAKAHLGETSRHITWIEPGNHYMLDFWLMRQCENFIIANSSFSWWAAWLIKNESKKIIAPKNWFGPAANGKSSKGLYCPGWIVF